MNIKFCVAWLARREFFFGISKVNKNGKNFVAASILFVLLVVVVLIVVYSKIEGVVVSLSPEVDCYGLDFKAEIVRGQSVVYLDVVNLGNLQIEGFYIKLFGNGDSDVYEEVDLPLERGENSRVVLTRNYEPGRYLIIPRVEGDDSEGENYSGICKDLYGYEVVLE